MQKLLLSMVTLLSFTIVTPGDKLKGPNTYSSKKYMESNLGNLARKTQTLGNTPRENNIRIIKRHESAELNSTKVTTPATYQFNKNDFPPLK
ncbi:MAG: hypothetical protein ACXWL5_00535 [Candidatus Chromulinivorax sp.]